MANKFSFAVVAVALALFGAYFWFTQEGHNADADLVDGGIIVPQLSGLAQQGEGVFNENCAACHGVNLAGTNQGPTLIHGLYRPNHHGDGAIALAAMNGVRAHHWPFGDMPPVEGINPQKLTVIIAYIRAIQQANGIR